MIGFREQRERTKERRLSWARLAILFLWLILVFSLLSLFFSMDKETKTTMPPKRPSFTRALFHTPSSTTKRSRLVLGVATATTSATAVTATTKFYGDDKRIIHTGPNPLHN
ncbi:hypothetical protein Fmac_006017 [Flemingia macrophylla]|uniref:Uncharacterized protein n=1 Tax=Flemingia macrophylla TaxID=520843 RepID=A0ABD1NAK2_9FABA